MYSFKQHSFQVMFVFQISISIFATLCYSFDIKQPKTEIYTNNHEDCREGEYQGIIRISKVKSIFYDYLIRETI